MKYFPFLALPSPRTRLATRRLWTCSSCRASLRSRLRPFEFGRLSSNSSRPFSTAGSPRPKLSPRRLVVLLSTTGGAAAVGAGTAVVAFTDDVKNSYEAAERTARVASALWICVNDYRTTLNAQRKVDDSKAQTQLLKDCHKRCAERTLKVLEQNGGIFIKLGQHLSAMNYLLPLEWTSTFIPLQDQCPISSFASISHMFETDTGTSIADHFSDFSTTPIGAASLAQVHLATVRSSGQCVAVKVQHPSLAQWSHLDLALTRYTFATLKWFFPEYDLEWLASEMEVSLPIELDFREEAANARRTKEYFSKIPGTPLVIPEVLWAEKRILVMAHEAGHRPDDVEFLDREGIDRDEVSAALAHIFNEMIFGRDAPLHCDPHGGNLAIRRNASRGRGGPNFDVILYDHGLYRDIPIALRRSYAKMWLAIIDGNLDRMREHAHAVAGIKDDEFPLFASAITGRAFSVLESSGSILQPKEVTEKEMMNSALQDGLLANLVGLLGRVPRIILLILKTNDLTRSLDEGLKTKQGQMRTFMILARYCARTVFEEEVETIRAERKDGTWTAWPGSVVKLLVAWFGYVRVESKLEVFELWMRLKRVFGLQFDFGVGSKLALSEP